MEPERVETAADQSELGRLGGIFFAPTETYHVIAQRPSWLLPLVVLVVLSLALTWWIGQRVGWEGIVRAQLEQRSSFREAPAEQREQMVRQGSRTAPIFGYVFGGLSMPILALVVSGVLLFVFNVMLGSELDFRRMFSVVSWSLMPYAVATVLGFIIIALKPPEDVDVQNLVASNVGALFDPDRTSKPLLSVLRSLDLFTAWQIFLLSTGLAAAGRKLSFGKALTWVLIAWAIWVVVKAGGTAIFS